MGEQEKKQAKNKNLGEWGEQVAKKYILEKFSNLEFVQQNYHAQGGEIDLIFKEKNKDFWHFIEVKTRKNNYFGDITESITKTKIKKIMKAIAHYFFVYKKQSTMSEFQINALFLEIKNKKVFCEYFENIGLENF